MAHYRVLRSDLRKAYDTVICTRVNRKAAEKIVRKMNAQAMREYFEKSRPIPLYYCERVECR